MVADHSNQLHRLLQQELVSIPLDKWGYFFPCWIAVWRYIDERWPASLGEVKATYTTEPVFEGHAAEWFCNVLGNQEEILDVLEAIMYPLADHMPASAMERGFVKDLSELPHIDPVLTDKLAVLIEQQVLQDLISGN